MGRGHYACRQVNSALLTESPESILLGSIYRIARIALFSNPNGCRFYLAALLCVNISHFSSQLSRRLQTPPLRLKSNSSLGLLFNPLNMR